MARITFWIILLSICVTGVSGQGRRAKQKKQLTLFQLNDKGVPADEFIYLYKKNHQTKPREYTVGDINEYLDLFIKFKLKVEEARQRGMDTTAAFIAEYNSYRNELIKPYLPDNQIMDSLVQLTYDRLKEEVRVSHILIGMRENPTPADTLEAYDRILDIKEKLRGGADFGEMAKQYSEDPSAKTNKGDLGYFTALQMVFPFESAAYRAAAGKLTGPVRSRFGYHLILVTDRHPSRGEVEVSHIMIRTNQRDEEKSKNIIFNIYDQLMAGASWDELCRQYSEDQNSKENGGRLRAFGVGAMASVPEFDKIAFSLNEGEISDPFSTSFGWHILRVERKIPLPPLDEMKQQLKNRVARDDRFAAARGKWMERLKRDNGFFENAEVKTVVFESADSSLMQGKWDSGRLAGIGSEPLFSMGGHPYEVRKFTNYVTGHQHETQDSPQRLMSKLYEGFVEETLLDIEGTKIVKRLPEFGMLANEYYEGILLFDIMEKEVWNKATEDTVGQMNYFLKNRSRYIAGDRVKATFYSHSDSLVVAPLNDLMQRNDSVAIAKYAEGHSIKVERGVFEKGDRAILGSIEWSPGPHSAQNKGMYYLAWIRDILPPGQKTFEEARAEVVADFQNELETIWISQLQKKYPVKINEKARRYVLDQLKGR